MTIPKNAREVYLGDDGQPIAYCPVDSLGMTDIIRAQFFMINKDELLKKMTRAREKGTGFCVVCINVDDARWRDLVELLMPGFDWQPFRDRGETPVARGVVPSAMIQEILDEMYPAAGKLPGNGHAMVVFDAGGASIFLQEPA